MLIDLAHTSIYIKPGVTDMRKQINGLAGMVVSEMKKDVFNDGLFIFCSRNRRQLKMLYWDRNGFCLWCKRLEQDKFPWPKDNRTAISLTHEKLKMVLDGIDFFHAHQRLNYSHVM